MSDSMMVEEDRPKSRPLEVLDRQMDVIRFWERSPYAPICAEAFESLTRHWMTEWPLDVYLANRFARAESIFVRSHIVSRLENFSRNYEPPASESALLPQDLPVEDGFAWLEHPIYGYDARGQRCSVRVIFWFKEANGVFVGYLSDALDTQDDISKELIETHGFRGALLTSRVPLHHFWCAGWGQDLRHIDKNNFALESYRDDLPPDIEEENKERAKDDTLFIFRFVLSLWDFMGQQLPARMLPDRALKKRLIRANSGLEDVKVVELRTQEQNHRQSEDPQEVLWTHRWRVRPHTRHWIDKHGVYRETTVGGYVKGPEHLPLIEKDTVFNVRR